MRQLHFGEYIFSKKVQKKFATNKKESIFALAKRNYPVEHLFFHCGNSSVGRAQPCQGWGREFESRFPLKIRWLAKCQPFFIFCKLTRTSNPKLPPSRGLGGINKSSREMPARSAGSSLVFHSKSNIYNRNSPCTIVQGLFSTLTCNPNNGKVAAHQV